PVGELHAPVFKPQGANHTVAIQPVAISEIAPSEACRPVYVVSPAEKSRDRAFDVVNLVGLLTRFQGESPLDQGRKVIHKRPPERRAPAAARGNSRAPTDRTTTGASRNRPSISRSGGSSGRDQNGAGPDRCSRQTTRSSRPARRREPRNRC